MRNSEGGATWAETAVRAEENLGETWGRVAPKALCAPDSCVEAITPNGMALGGGAFGKELG